MALIFADRVRDTSTTTGTGTITLADSAPTKFQKFGAIAADGDLVPYTIEHRTEDEWEVGLGTYDTTGPTLARTVVLSSSNSNAAVNFSAGTKDVFLGKVAASESVINVKMFGAKGDSTTDDTTAIQAALDAIPSGGGELFVPTGTYLLSSALTVSDKPIIIRGEGARVSVFLFDDCDGLDIDMSGVTVVRKPTIISCVSLLSNAAGTRTGLSYTGKRGVQYAPQLLFDASELGGVDGGYWSTNAELTDAGQSIFSRYTISGDDVDNRSLYGIRMEGSKDVKIVDGVAVYLDDAVFATNDSEGVAVHRNHLIAVERGVVSDSNVGNMFDVSHNHIAAAVSAVVLGSDDGVFDNTGSSHSNIESNFVLMFEGMADHTATDFIGFDVASDSVKIANNEILRTTGSRTRVGVRLRAVGSAVPDNAIVAHNTFTAMSQGVILDSGVTNAIIGPNKGINTRSNMIVDNSGQTSNRFYYQDAGGTSWKSTRFDFDGDLNMVGAGNGVYTIYSSAAPSTGPLIWQRARGSATSPSAVLSGDTIAGINARGYMATGFSPTGRATFSFRASENWTDSANGTDFVLETTPNGSTSRVVRLKIGPSGEFVIRPPSAAGTLANNGEVAIEFTDDTTLTFRARGSDGTTRSATLTLS